MHTHDFLHSIKVRCTKNDQIKTIDDLRSIQLFLQQWPVERRGPVFQCALNSCSAALSGHVAAEDARRSFVSFARITGILIDEGNMAVVGHHTQMSASVSQSR